MPLCGSLFPNIKPSNAYVVRWVSVAGLIVFGLSFFKWLKTKNENNLLSFIATSMICLLSTAIDSVSYGATFAFSWGIANALAAQAAISRVLFSMARDKKLPTVLAKVHPKYQTPYISTIIVAIISLGVGLFFQSQIANLTVLVNFGALVSFLLLHISVINHYIIREKSKNYFKHLIMPIIGFAVIAYVLYGMDIAAIKLGSVWIVIGLIYLAVLSLVLKQKPTSIEL
jgi:amino acid transporter